MSSHHFNRIVGQYHGNSPGPSLIITGGLHGNEPGGLIAAERVLLDLEHNRRPFSGTLKVLACNLCALKTGSRFIDRDLNRRWTDAHLLELSGRPKTELGAEDREQLELFELFQALEQNTKNTKDALVFLDLHTTSGQSPPFVCFADTPSNRAIASQLALPSILGLEEIIDASMLRWLSGRGHIGIAIEGGQHETEAAVLAHISAIWLFFAAAGAMRAEDVPDFKEHQLQLKSSWPTVPPVLQIRHRHVVGPEDTFVMRPGFQSFEPVRQGQALADCNGQEIRSPMDALLLMPRYQPQGEDAFFLAAPPGTIR